MQIADQQSPQQWDDLVFSSQKKEQNNRMLQFNLEYTAHNLQKQLTKNKELNDSYHQNLQNYHNRSMSDQNVIDDEQFYSQPYPLSDDEQHAKPNKEYFQQIVNKYGRQNKCKRRECCKSTTIDMPRIPKKMSDYSKEEVWGRLLEDKREVFEQREKDKRKLLDELTLNNCPFRPNIGEVLSRRHTDQPIEDRLYQDGQEQKLRREQLVRDQQQQYTFKPVVSSYRQVLKGDSLFAKPLYERIDEVMKKKQEELLRKQQEHNNSQDTTFHPKISQKSTMIADQKQTQRSVVDRLVEDAVLKIQRSVDQTYKEKGVEQCTFIPEINPTLNDVKQINQVHHTQYMIADFMREKKQKLIEEVIKNSEYTFKPTINKQSELIIESNDDRINENSNDKYNRLGQKDYQKNQMLKEQLQEAYYQQYTFKPQINQISSMIARKRSLDSLAYNPEAKEKLKQLKEEQQSRESSSFYPQVFKNSQYQHIKSKYEMQTIKENMQLALEIKERKICDMRKQMEYEQIKDCTFRPKTVQCNISLDTEPIAKKVKGMDKFIQNKENHRRQEQEKLERYQSVFHQETKYNFKNHLQETKPEPFKISQKNANAMRQLQEEAIQREKEQCTFQPVVNSKQQFY